MPSTAAAASATNSAEPRPGHSVRRKGKLVEQQHQRDGDDERSAGEDRRAAQPRTQPQPLLHPRDIGIELALLAHTSSRCVPM